MHLGDLSWPDVKTLPLDRMVVVLPTGSFEQHGPHLPFTVDTDLVTAVAERVEERFPDTLLLLPTLWPGMSTHHNAFSPERSMCRSHLHRARSSELGLSIARMGARKSVFPQRPRRK